MSNLLVSIVFLTLPLSGCVQTAECDRVTGCSMSAPVCYNYECVETCGSDAACDDDEWCAPCEDSEACQESGDGAAAKVCIPR